MFVSCVREWCRGRLVRNQEDSPASGMRKITAQIAGMAEQSTAS